KSSLIALGTTAVIAVYAAGFLKTQAAAAQFAEQDTERRRPAPTVHPEVPVAATTTPAAPRAQAPAVAAPSKPTKAAATPQASQPPETTKVAATKTAADAAPVAPAPTVTPP